MQRLLRGWVFVEFGKYTAILNRSDHSFPDRFAKIFFGFQQLAASLKEDGAILRGKKKTARSTTLKYLYD